MFDNIPFPLQDNGRQSHNTKATHFYKLKLQTLGPLNPLSVSGTRSNCARYSRSLWRENSHRSTYISKTCSNLIVTDRVIPRCSRYPHSRVRVTTQCMSVLYVLSSYGSLQSAQIGTPTSCITNTLGAASQKLIGFTNPSSHFHFTSLLYTYNTFTSLLPEV